MFGSWVAGVFIRFSSNGVNTLGRLSSASAAANAQFARSQGLIDKNTAAMLRYQRRMEAIRTEQLRFGTAFAGVGAIVGGAFMAYGITQAAQFERAMTGVKIATGATADEFQRLGTTALKVSGFTAQSAVTIAQEMAMAARSGLNDPKKLQKAFPQIAMLADVQWMANKQDPVQSVKFATQFAHFFGAYSGKPLQNMLDDVNRLMFMMPEHMQNLVTQGRYFIPTATKAGVDERTIMEFLAIMGTTGFLQGKGGTAMNNLVLNALGAEAGTAHLSKARRRGLSDLGLVDHTGQFRFVDSKGHLLLQKMVDHLTNMRAIMIHQDPRRGQGRWITDATNAFGKEAARLVAVVADPQTQARMADNRKTFKRIGGVQDTWAQYNTDFFLAWQKFTTNLQNVAMTVFLPSLPKLTKFFNGIADSLGGLVTFLSSHPETATFFAKITAGLTGVFALRFTLGAFALAVKGFGLAMDATTLKVLKDEAALGVGAGAGVGGKFMQWIDRVLFAGLGGGIAAGWKGTLRFFDRLLPTSILKLEPLYQKFAVWSSRIFLSATTIEGALGLLGGALSKLLGPLGLVLTLMQLSKGANIDETLPLMGQGRDYWRSYAKAHGWNAVPKDVRSQFADGRAADAKIHIEHLHLPNVKNADDFVESMRNPMTILRQSGAQRTAPTLPNPFSIGGTSFAH